MLSSYPNTSLDAQNSDPSPRHRGRRLRSPRPIQVGGRHRADAPLPVDERAPRADEVSPGTVVLDRGTPRVVRRVIAGGTSMGPKALPTVEIEFEDGGPPLECSPSYRLRMQVTR